MKNNNWVSLVLPSSSCIHMDNAETSVGFNIIWILGRGRPAADREEWSYDRARQCQAGTLSIRDRAYGCEKRVERIQVMMVGTMVMRFLEKSYGTKSNLKPV